MLFFENIIGNEQIKKQLLKAVEKKSLGNTMLFSGVEGIGKFLFAKALALYLMDIDLDNASTIDRIDKEIHPDFRVFRPEGKVLLHSISIIKELIEQVSFVPYEATSKVFIIDEVDRMLPSSFNALLKVLEEPNLDSYIILITNKEMEILPTVLSRCHKFKFSPLTDKEITALLEERWGKTKLESKRIASLAQGSISRAIDIASFVEEDDLTRILMGILSKNSVKNYIDLSMQFDAIQQIFDNWDKKENEESSYKFKAIDVFFSYIFMWYRDLFLLKNNVSLDRLFFSDKIEFLKKSYLSNNVSLQQVNFFLSEAKESVSRNIKLKTCLERLFFKLR